MTRPPGLWNEDFIPTRGEGFGAHRRGLAAAKFPSDQLRYIPGEEEDVKLRDPKHTFPLIKYVMMKSCISGQGQNIPSGRAGLGGIIHEFIESENHRSITNQKL